LDRPILRVFASSREKKSAREDAKNTKTNGRPEWFLNGFNGSFQIDVSLSGEKRAWRVFRDFRHLFPHRFLNAAMATLVFLKKGE